MNGVCARLVGLPATWLPVLHLGGLRVNQELSTSAVVSVGLTWVLREELPHHFCGTDVIDRPTKDPFSHVFAAWPGMGSTFDRIQHYVSISQRSSRKQDAGYLEQSESQRGLPRICFVAPSVASSTNWPGFCPAAPCAKTVEGVIAGSATKIANKTIVPMQILLIASSANTSRSFLSKRDCVSVSWVSSREETTTISANSAPVLLREGLCTALKASCCSWIRCRSPLSDYRSRPLP